MFWFGLVGFFIICLTFLQFLMYTLLKVMCLEMRKKTNLYKDTICSQTLSFILQPKQLIYHLK